jgi:hypothetical protein
MYNKQELGMQMYKIRGSLKPVSLTWLFMQLVFDKNYLIHFHTAGSYVKLHPSLVKMSFKVEMADTLTLATK